MSAGGDGAIGPGDGELVSVAARTYERDRYLAALLSPRAVRDDLLALAAFAGEIARIPATVTEPMMGEVRLQWWREALAGWPADNRTGHPIADAVRASMRRHALPAGLLVGIIDAHVGRLAKEAPADDRALESHLENTEGALFTLTWRVLAGPGAQEPSADLAAAGKAYGLARAIYEFPILSAQGRTLIPATRLNARGVSLDKLSSGLEGESVRALLGELATLARQHARTVAARWPTAPRALHTALMPLALVEPYLQAQEGPSGGMVEISPLVRVWRLWRAHRLGRI